MVVKLKNVELENTINAISQLDTSKLKASASYKITKILKTLQVYYGEMVEARQELQKKHLKKDEEGNFVKAQDEEGKEIEDRFQVIDVDVLNKEMVDLLNVDVEITTPVHFTMQELDEIGIEERVPIPLSIMFALEPFIK